MDKTDIKVLVLSCAALAAIGASVSLMINEPKEGFDYSVQVIHNFNSKRCGTVRGKLEDADIKISDWDNDGETDADDINNTYRREIGSPDKTRNMTVEFRKEEAEYKGRILADVSSREVTDKEALPELPENIGEKFDRVAASNGLVAERETNDYFCMNAVVVHTEDPQIFSDVLEWKNRIWEEHSEYYSGRYREESFEVLPQYDGFERTENAFFEYIDYDANTRDSIECRTLIFNDDHLIRLYFIINNDEDLQKVMDMTKKLGTDIPDQMRRLYTDPRIVSQREE